MGLISKKVVEAARAVSDDEFKAYVGDNSYKYMPVLEKVRQGKLAYFGFAPLLIGPAWVGYRKLWIGLLAYLGLAIALTAFGDVLYILLWVGLSFVLPARYVVHVCRKIQSIKAYEQDPNRLKSILEKKGGTSILSAIITFLIWVSVIFLVLAPRDVFSEVSLSSVPACDSRSGISATIQAFEGGPMSKVMAIKLFDIEDTKEISFDEGKNVRVCQGMAMTNAGQTRVKYTFSGREGGEYWVEVREF